MGLPVHMNFRALAERIVIPPTWRFGIFPSHFVVNKSRRTRIDFKYNHGKIEMVMLESYMEKLEKKSATELSYRILCRYHADFLTCIIKFKLLKAR